MVSWFALTGRAGCDLLSELPERRFLNAFVQTHFKPRDLPVGGDKIGIAMDAIPFDPWWLFRWSDESRDADEPEPDVVEDEPVPGIRCPLCKWRPKKSDVWTCWDCDHPEYFYGGCGTQWNTFASEGICPTCLHQWRWTSCYGCLMWSRHKDWYEAE